MKRHTCIICKKKRYEDKMSKIFEIGGWACKDKCEEHKDIEIGINIIMLHKKLKKINYRYLFGK